MCIRDSAPDIQDALDAEEVSDVKGAIDFENVSFAYEGTQEKVLSHVNLKVKAGEYVALVGSSGAGKTTLCSLIPRFLSLIHIFCRNSCLGNVPEVL